MNGEKKLNFMCPAILLGQNVQELFSVFRRERNYLGKPSHVLVSVWGLCCNWADVICTSLLLSSCTVIMNNSLNGFIISKCQRAQTLLCVYVTVLIANEKHLHSAEYKLHFYILLSCAKLAATLLGYSAWCFDIDIHLIFNVRAAVAIII